MQQFFKLNETFIFHLMQPFSVVKIKNSTFYFLNNNNFVVAFGGLCNDFLNLMQRLFKEKVNTFFI